MLLPSIGIKFPVLTLAGCEGRALIPIILLQENKGKINFEEFCNVVGNTDIHTKMVVQV